MTEPLKELQKTLKTNGYSLTEARTVVFEALQGEEPQTMQQLVNVCPGINQTSVYRAVSLFEKLGITQKLQIGWKYKIELTDAFHDHHHHLTCQRCGKIIPFEEGESLEALLQDIAQRNQFVMREHQLEIQGLCRSCRPRYA
jgi:Fur family ferric uptake transcriptional regulator